MSSVMNTHDECNVSITAVSPLLRGIFKEKMISDIEIVRVYR